MYQPQYNQTNQYPYRGITSMYGLPETYMDMYENQRRLMELYPDIYRRVYPRVQNVCQRMDVVSNPRMYPYIDPTLLEEMIQQVYQVEARETTKQQGGYLRDLITILFIRELLSRRRGYFHQYPSGYWGGYPVWDGGGIFPGF